MGKKFVILEIKSTAKKIVITDHNALENGLEEYVPIDGKKDTNDYREVLRLFPERIIDGDRLRMRSPKKGEMGLSVGTHGCNGWQAWGYDGQSDKFLILDPEPVPKSDPNKFVGQRVTVYDRYLFAVPVMGVITGVSHTDGAFQIDFNSDNPGGHSVTQHNGKYFHQEQCKVHGRGSRTS